MHDIWTLPLLACSGASKQENGPNHGLSVSAEPNHPIRQCRNIRSTQLSFYSLKAGTIVDADQPDEIGGSAATACLEQHVVSSSPRTIDWGQCAENDLFQALQFSWMIDM